MNVMTLVEAFTRPDGGTRQRVDQVFTLNVRFTEGRAGSFPVVLLCYGIGYVGIEVETLIAFFPHFPPSFNSA